jgi:hypothetical protein
MHTIIYKGVGPGGRKMTTLEIVFVSSLFPVDVVDLT